MPYSERLTAGGGCEHIADTSTHSGKEFYAFIAQEDTVVATLTGGAGDSQLSPPTNYLTLIGLTSKTLHQGALIVCPANEYFETIKLTSGSIIAYK